MVKMPHWPALPRGGAGIKYGLERITALLKALGNPEKKIAPVVHVTGTNGKGSVLAYLKAIFECSGYKAHRYISPSLIEYNERIHLSGQDIDDSFLFQCLEECRIAAQEMEVSLFEGTTGAAFLAFSKVPADVVLLEVGMGGIWDATNVVDNTLLSIITPISYDHTEYLGDTLEQIASEKVGIIKRNSACVVSWQYDYVMSIVKQKCEELNALCFACGESWNCVANADCDGGFVLKIGEQEIQLPKPSLVGIHQIMNASVAAVSALYLSNHYKRITVDNIRAGIQKALWPARMQKITNGILHTMLPEGAELWLDGAHNYSGAEMVAATMRHMQPKKPLYIINGRTGNRDIKGFLNYFLDQAKMVCGVEVRNEPLAEKAEKITAAALELGMRAKTCTSVKDAVDVCLRDNEYKPCTILITGSLYLAGDVLWINQV